jgi:hypothetical protein
LNDVQSIGGVGESTRFLSAALIGPRDRPALREELRRDRSTDPFTNSGD